MNQNESGQIRWKERLAAFLLPAVLFLLLLIKNRIVPFGNTTLLYSDLDSQYIEFMAEFRRILLGEGSLFYSWHAGLGMNFLAITAYYLASPFNLLLVLFPEAQLPLAVSLITTLKLGCAGAAFAYYLKRISPKNGGVIPMLSVCWALSAYALGYAFNIMWLDALIWLPLLCAGTEDLLEGRRGSMGKLILFFAVSFISQFYMAFMTGIFCALYFITRLILRSSSIRSGIGHIIRFALCTGIAAGLSAVLLVPTFFVLKNNMGLLGQEFPAAAFSFPLQDILQKLFIGSFDGVKDCLPHIYCGLPALIGLVLYFSGKGIPLREKVVSGLIGAFLLGSFWFRPLDFLWHAMDHPSWFPFRYAFLFSFWALSCACRGLAESSRERSSIWKWALIMVPLGAAFLFSTVRPDSRFLWINLSFIVFYTLSGVFAAGKIRQLLFTVICAAELLINGAITTEFFADGCTKLSDYQSFHEHYRELTDAVQPAAGEFYRFDKLRFRNFNDPLGIGIPGISHFSSTASTRQTNFLKRLGFNCFATWCSYQGSTAVSDALLRIRYEFADAGKSDSIPAGTETWEHPAQFPLFFFAPEAFARYDFNADSVKAIQRQNDLLHLLDTSNEADFYEEMPVEWVKTVNLEPSDEGYLQRRDAQAPAYAELVYTPDPERSNYLYVPGASLNYNVYVNDTLMISASRDYSGFPICLDPFTNGADPLRIRIETTIDRLTDGVSAWALDTDRLLDLSNRISGSAPVTERSGKTSFTLNTDAADEERLIVSSIPFDAGWRVNADGRQLPLKMIHESVLGLILPAGSTSVQITYIPYGWEAGLALSGAALVLWAVCLWLELRTKRTESK